MNTMPVEEKRRKQQADYHDQLQSIVRTIHGNLDRYGKAGCATTKVVERQAIAVVIAQRSGVFVMSFDTNGLILSLTRPERTSTNS
jgi:hypothetical protein